MDVRVSFNFPLGMCIWLFAVLKRNMFSDLALSSPSASKFSLFSLSCNTSLHIKRLSWNVTALRPILLDLEPFYLPIPLKRIGLHQRPTSDLVRQVQRSGLQKMLIIERLLLPLILLFSFYFFLFDILSLFSYGYLVNTLLGKLSSTSIRFFYVGMVLQIRILSYCKDWLYRSTGNWKCCLCDWCSSAVHVLYWYVLLVV